ncbi:MAG: metal-dependent transcriptional regulator [Solirubrobacteraceae bacterium]
MAKLDVMESVTSAVEDYAKAIYTLERRSDGGAVTTTALAERLGVTAASASNMVKKLDGLGLVRHVPYRGVQLTPEGRGSRSRSSATTGCSSCTWPRSSACRGTACTTRPRSSSTCSPRSWRS